MVGDANHSFKRARNKISPLMTHHYGHFGVINHIFGHTAVNKMLDSCTPVGIHHDNIGFHFLA